MQFVRIYLVHNGIGYPFDLTNLNGQNSKQKMHI